MNKITKTLAIVGVVLAIGAALSAFVPQVAFAQTATSSSAGVSTGPVASSSSSSAATGDTSSCSAGGGPAAFGLSAPGGQSLCFS